MSKAALDGPGLRPAASRVDLAAIMLLSLAVRLTWVTFGAWESNDSRWYISTARNLVQHHFYSADGSHPTAYRPPLYPTFISVFWFGTAAPVFAVLIIQAVLGALTVTFVYLMAYRLRGRAVALIAGVGLAMAPLTCRFTAVILTETIFTFLVTLGIFGWSRNRYALSGVSFGLAILTRVTLLPFVVFLTLLTLFRPWRTYRRGYLTIMLVSMAVCSIWIVRNAVVFHQFIPVAASGYGTNLLIGSMKVDEADDVVRRKVLLNSVDVAGGVASTDELKFDRVRLRAALKRITETPVQWLLARTQQFPRLFIDSGSYLFGADEVPLRVAIREKKIIHIVVRGGMILASILVFGLAVLGICSLRFETWCAGYLPLFPIYLTIVSLPLWIEPRYGLPMMPSIAILAAIGAVELKKKLEVRTLTRG